MTNEQQDMGRSELIDKLRAVETPESATTLAELSYRRAREALEKAVAEAREVRLTALADARATREREMAALTESLSALRQAAEAEVQAIVTRAEIEAEGMRANARHEAEELTAAARRESGTLRAEAAALREAAEERLREVQRLEADFNAMLTRVAERLGLGSQPERGWLRRRFGSAPK